MERNKYLCTLINYFISNNYSSIKKLTLSFICIATSLVTFANPIDQGKALQIANQFLTGVKAGSMTGK